MEKTINSPVLFLVFNRPEKTQRVFDVIRSAKPRKLYVAADGPRSHVPGDFEKCALVKEIVTKIDWDCETKYLFHEKNLGCSLAGKTAWDWFFDKEDEMIFIEDDGLVSKSFFWFCQEMLIRYKDDHRIAYISGENFGPKYGNATYFYSRMGGGTYSMGSWKRVYSLYEYKMESYPSIKSHKKFKKNFITNFAYKYLTRFFDSYITKGGNTYDIQMVYLLYKHNMFNIIPNINLCSNIGYDFDGANSIDPNSELSLKLGNLPKSEISEIIHPAKFEVNIKFEKKYFAVRVLYEPWFKAIYKYYDIRYGYHAWKKMAKRILIYLKILNYP